jgi:hypothetical protein
MCQRGLGRVQKYVIFIASVCVWEDSTGGKVVVPTYVDNSHIIGKTREGVQHIKAELQKHFKLCDLGPINWFLGIDIHITTLQAILSSPNHSRQLDIFHMENVTWSKYIPFILSTY